MADRVELWGRTVRRLTLAAVAANALGGVLMFTLLEFLVPLGPAPDDRDLVLNGIVAAIYLPLGLIIGNLWARRHGDPIRRWLSEDRPPTAEERSLVLSQPSRFVAISGFFWVLAAILFTAINIPKTGWEALVVGGGMLLAGETTCAVGYLMIERLIRPVTALALAGSPPPEHCRTGVGLRLTMTWSLGTGIPLLGILVVSTAGLVDPGQDSALMAAAVAFLAGIGLLVGSFAISVASRSVADPISAVRRAMARVEEGDYDAQVPVDASSEVGLLISGFNSMAAGLRERERMRDLFGRHVGREVAQAALERDGDVELGGELREVAIVFVDVVGSTNLAIRRPPGEGVTPPNRFFPASSVSWSRRSRRSAAGSTSSRATRRCASSARRRRCPTTRAPHCGPP